MPDPQLRGKPVHLQVLYRTPPGSHPEIGHDDCVISDFGLAAYVDPNGGRLYTIAGSAGYSAPEMYPPEGIVNGQGRGNGYGLKADMWSLGVIGELLSLSLSFGSARRVNIRSRVPCPTLPPVRPLLTLHTSLRSPFLSSKRENVRTAFCCLGGR